MPVNDQKTSSTRKATRLVQRLSGRVLIVDDELPNRLYLRKLLESRGCEVFDAASGAEALEIALKHQPDLFLVDIIMPEMDGFELCGKLHDEPRTANSPIIMVTAKSKIEDIEAGFELGAMDYIQKPFNPRELIIRVKNALALKKSNDELTLWNSRVARDIELAGAIQRSLFSDVPHFSRRFEVRIAYRTCMDVGGDAFDIIALPDGRYCVYVADVSGHGVAPAMISSLLKAMASEMIYRYSSQGPSAICNALNSAFRRRIDNPSYFATLFMALYDPETVEWHCMNCGHPNPIFVRHGSLGDSAQFSAGGGTPIGFPFGDEKPYSTADEVVFSGEGDTFLLLYTDGLSEARHLETKEECGDRVDEVYEQVVRDPFVTNKSTALLDALEVENFSLEGDDCTAISIQMLSPTKIVLEQFVPRNIYLVSEVAKQCETAVVARGISANSAALVRLLVMELGANLVEHSGLSEDASFWLQVRVDGSVCQLIFKDKGDEWDLDKAIGHSLDEFHMGERGRGLAITNTISNRIERYRVNTENLTYCTVIDEEGC